EHLPNAIGLNSILFQTASAVGPALAGIAMAATGVASVYALNALSFVAVIGALLLMRDLPPTRPLEREAISVRALVEGLRFVFGRPLIRSTMLLDGIATFFCSATALLPIFAQDVLQVGPHGYGLLYGAPSIGAVLSSLIMVRLAGRIVRRGPVLIGAVTAYGAATVVFGFSRAFWVMFLALAVTGAADTISGVLRNIVRQFETPDRLRGRMVGISMLFFMGGPQLGEFESGLAAQWLRASAGVVAGGVPRHAAPAAGAPPPPPARRPPRGAAD